jgi:multiple sugar transport system substrate-binding protein
VDGRTSSRWRRLVAAAGVGVVLTSSLAACGDGSTATGTPTLNWYVNPDNGGQQKIAEDCSAASGGKYAIDVSILPSDAALLREQLMRRLAGGDTSIDLMSLDPVFVPETSEAGFLAPVPEELRATFTDGVVDGAVQGATWKDELVAAPFWANTQLLWYRKSVAEAAGLDMTKPVTWQQLIEAAKAQGTAIGVQGQRAESMTVWVNAMIASAGGEVIQNPDAKGPDIRLGVDSDAGKAAAAVMQQIADAGVGGPGIDNRDEAATANLFQQEGAAFMVNWPFVYAQGKAAAEGGTMDQAVFDDYGWTTYPAMDEGTPAKPARSPSTPTSPTRPCGASSRRRTRPPTWSPTATPPPWSRSTTIPRCRRRTPCTTPSAPPCRPPRRGRRRRTTTRSARASPTSGNRSPASPTAPRRRPRSTSVRS